MSARTRTTNKFGAIKTTIDGIRFDSKMEAAYYQRLKLLKRAGEVKDFELQPSYTLQPSFKKYGRTHRAITYKADFLVTYSDGTQEIVDVKGKETEGFKLKRKLFDNRYPDLVLKVVTLYRSSWVELPIPKTARNVRRNMKRNR